MNSLGNEQLLILNKIKDFLKSRNNKDKKTLSSDYYCSFSLNTGFALLKYWVNKKNFFFLLITVFKEIYAIFNIGNYRLLKNENLNLDYDKIILTWGNNSNLSKNAYFDKYFNVSSTETKKILWIVICNEKIVSNNNLENVVFIEEEKTNFFKKIKNFINGIYKLIFLSQKKMIDVLHKLTWHYFFSEKIFLIFDKLIHEKVNLVLMPYECQPFQSKIINETRSLNKNIKFHGFIHSYPSLPSHLLHRKESPDKIILTSPDQYFTFTNYLGWQKENIKLLPSARFRKNKFQDMRKKIFLPISFTSTKFIFKHFLKICRILNDYDLSEFEIRNHPASKSSKKHLNLIKKIETVILQSDNKNKKKITNVSIFIGATGSIIEALEQNIFTYHICEEPIFESYNSILWPSLKIQFITNNLITYKLADTKKIIMFGESNYKIDEYLNE